MKRYKLDRRSANDERQLYEHPRGDFVKYEDVAEALNIIGELTMRDNIALYGFQPLVHRARIFMEG